MGARRKNYYFFTDNYGVKYKACFARDEDEDENENITRLPPKYEWYEWERMYELELYQMNGAKMEKVVGSLDLFNVLVEECRDIERIKCLYGQVKGNEVLEKILWLAIDPFAKCEYKIIRERFTGQCFARAFWVVGKIFVIPEFRGRGIATNLLTEIQELIAQMFVPYLTKKPALVQEINVMLKAFPLELRKIFDMRYGEMNILRQDNYYNEEQERYFKKEQDRLIQLYKRCGFKEIIPEKDLAEVERGYMIKGKYYNPVQSVSSNAV